MSVDQGRRPYRVLPGRHFARPAPGVATFSHTGNIEIHVVLFHAGHFGTDRMAITGTLPAANRGEHSGGPSRTRLVRASCQGGLGGLLLKDGTK